MTPARPPGTGVHGGIFPAGRALAVREPMVLRSNQCAAYFPFSQELEGPAAGHFLGLLACHEVAASGTRDARVLTQSPTHFLQGRLLLSSRSRSGLNLELPCTPCTGCTGLPAKPARALLAIRESATSAVRPLVLLLEYPGSSAPPPAHAPRFFRFFFPAKPERKVPAIRGSAFQRANTLHCYLAPTEVRLMRRLPAR